MTQLQKMTLEELERRNYSQATVQTYIDAIRRFAEHFHRSPDHLGPLEIREYQLHLYQRKLHLMTLYSTGMRRSELCHLRPEDIDKERMVVRIRRGKGGKDREVPLSPKLLEQLRTYYRSVKVS